MYYYKLILLRHVYFFNSIFLRAIPICYYVIIAMKLLGSELMKNKNINIALVNNKYKCTLDMNFL